MLWISPSSPSEVATSTFAFVTLLLFAWPPSDLGVACVALPWPLSEVDNVPGVLLLVFFKCTLGAFLVFAGAVDLFDVC